MRTAVDKLCFTILLGAAAAAVHAEDWPHWRGPRGIGVSGETNLPERWSATEQVAWKAPVAGAGISTPVVAGGRVYVTSQIGEGVSRQGPRLVQGGGAEAAGERALGARPASKGDGRTWFVVEAFDEKAGTRLWEYRIEADGPLPAAHDKHNLASPSPVTDGELVFAWFGTGQIVALNRDGKLVWVRHLGKEIAPFEINWGHSSSPTLDGDLLYLLCDHEPASYLLALDKRTGKERWKVDRGKGRASYSTPLVVDTARGAELIVNSSERIDAYDAKTGEFLWHAGESNRFPIPMPVVHEGTIYASRGYRSGPYLAIRTGGRGDVSASHVAWHVPTGAPYVSSIVHYQGLIYMATDNGILTIADASDGSRVWQGRVGGVFSASPVAGDGKVYLQSESGETIVLRAGRDAEIIARNTIGERTLASMAVASGRIFLRSDEHLFCIGPARQGR
ncbi:MAG TPA: PQQ-binding-like beta-propeller repeat protein [Vicinamibacterales bacterium]|nr:PQQ-binding-like beta-propeller repeat protein [Vicinamibacterales bacterium]